MPPVHSNWRRLRLDAPSERRRLQFLDGLFLAYAKVGGSPWMRSDEKREFYVMTRRRWIITVVTIVLVIAAMPTILDSTLHY